MKNMGVLIDRRTIDASVIWGMKTAIGADAFTARANLDTSVGVLPFDPTKSVRVENRIEEARQLLALSIHLRENGWPLKSKRFATRALAMFERECGAYHSEVVRALLCLAGAREDLADYARAGADYRRANAILGLTDDHSSRDVQRLRIRTLRGLASVLRALGRDRPAETLLKEALTVAERPPCGTPDDVASAMNDLGAQYRHTGAYEEASRLHHRALAIAEQALGPEHAQTATILHQLGVLERGRGQFAAGEGFARRSAAIRQKTWGPDHPQVAAEFARIAALLEAQGKHDEAASMHARAIVAMERWFGPDGREVATMSSATSPPHILPRLKIDKGDS